MEKGQFSEFDGSIKHIPSGLSCPLGAVLVNENRPPLLARDDRSLVPVTALSESDVA
jgi:hypothetical protein